MFSTKIANVFGFTLAVSHYVLTILSVFNNVLTSLNGLLLMMIFLAKIILSTFRLFCTLWCYFQMKTTNFQTANELILPAKWLWPWFDLGLNFKLTGEKWYNFCTSARIDGSNEKEWFDGCRLCTCCKFVKLPRHYRWFMTGGDRWWRHFYLSISHLKLT